MHQRAVNQYDLLIIGGGITGAVLANLASKKGLMVALLEKNTFASGTSSKSTKLLHGGIRYLEQFEFVLVREALKERYFWLQKAPHLVQPIRFIIPLYEKSRRPNWMTKLGVKLYDALSVPFGIGTSHVLSKEQVIAQVPGINEHGLVGGVSYIDVQMSDYGLCVANIHQAQRQGAICLEDHGIEEILKHNNKVVGVKAKGKEFLANHVVSATGPWSNTFWQMVEGEPKELLRLTKGVHLIYQKRLSDAAIVIQSHSDKRIFFAIPWDDATLIGTTDTDYHGKLDRVEVDSQDIDYLLTRTRAAFPNAFISPVHIRYSFAGLRPLVAKEGNPSQISRSHRIIQSPSGVTFILGGKYTTARIMAKDALLSLGLLQKKDDFELNIS